MFDNFYHYRFCDGEDCQLLRSSRQSLFQRPIGIDLKPCLICGDLNARPPMFGPCLSDSRGKIVEELGHKYIRSVLDYRCEAVDLGNERIKSVYEKIQAQALAICCGSMHGTSTASLQVECGDPPHDLRRQKLMAYHALRTIANNNEARNCYFLLDKNKNKTQARLHLMMKKKKKQLMPLETIEALIPRNFVEDFQKRANRERLDELALEAKAPKV